jgi:DNA-directed RNA polymerase specialized sigma24 family protein
MHWWSKLWRPTTPTPGANCTTGSWIASTATSIFASALALRPNAWLYDLAQTARRDHVRHQQMRPWCAGSDADVLSSAFNSLRPDEQEVLVLRFFERLACDETALLMNTATEAVTALETRALKHVAAQVHRLHTAESNRRGRP